MVKGRTHDVPPSVVAFAEHLSPRVRAALPHWEWTIREEQRFPHEELQRRLAEKGISEWPFLWPIEEAFAGVRVEMNWNDLEIGITENLDSFDRGELIDEHGRARFVPIGDWRIYTIFLDALGRMYLFHVPDDLTLIDASFEACLEDQAMS